MIHILGDIVGLMAPAILGIEAYSRHSVEVQPDNG